MILSPIKLGAVEVRNRVVVTAHGAREMFRNPMLPAAPYIEYLRRRVCLVTPYETVMPYAGISHRMETHDVLRRKLAAIYTGAVIGVADGRQVSVVRPDGESLADLEAGTIVAVTAPRWRPGSGSGAPSSATPWPHARRPMFSGTGEEAALRL
jgi:hypothetical protein